jgi:hypothetical protein
MDELGKAFADGLGRLPAAVCTWHAWMELRVVEDHGAAFTFRQCGRCGEPSLLIREEACS